MKVKELHGTSDLNDDGKEVFYIDCIEDEDGEIYTLKMCCENGVAWIQLEE